MANHTQAEKRNRQRIKCQAHHRYFRSTLRTAIKRVRAALDEKDLGRAREALKQAVPLLDQCARKGVIPQKRASRTVSRLVKAVTSLTA